MIKYMIAKKYSPILLKFVSLLMVAWMQQLCAQQLGVWYDSELQTDFKGHYNYANLLYLSADYPLGERFRLSAATMSIYKTRKEPLLDDLQGFTNIDADNLPFTLAVAGIGWQVNDRHSLFVGIRNVDEDYITSDVTSLFINSSCGIFPTLSCNMDIATYPLASMGLHYCYKAPSFCLQASVYNGQGYSRLSGSANLWRFCPHSDGLFGIAQIDWQRGKGHYYVGAAQHGGIGSEMATRSALWAYTEQTLTEQVALIADYSHAFGRSCDCIDFAGLGCQYSKGCSMLGLFTDYARFRHDSEWATELTYKLDLNKYLFVQYSFQMIHHGHWQPAGLVRVSLRI